MTNTRPYYGTNHEFKFWFCHVQARAQIPRRTTFLSHVFAISFAQSSLQRHQRKASKHHRTAKLTRRASPMSVHLSLGPYGTVGWSCSTSRPRTGGKAGGQYGAECFNRRCGWTVVRFAPHYALSLALSGRKRIQRGLEYVFTWERMHARSCGGDRDRIVRVAGCWLRHWHCSRASSSILGCSSGWRWAGVGSGYVAARSSMACH
jgi:hypothetical protein